MICFVIFAHNDLQTNEDVQDLIDNIKFFHPDSDFIVNHPTLDHPKVSVRHRLGPLDRSSFIFGALEAVIRKLTDEEIRKFDHFVLVSANQYFINKIDIEKGVNYIQFLNTEDWENDYTGKDFCTKIVGFPLQQKCGKWDNKDLYKKFDIEIPMPSNWECQILTTEAMLLAKQHIDVCTDLYINEDAINFFTGYMALLTGQEWRFPAHFGTYDPSNPYPKNWILTQDQVTQKWQDGYFSVKRVNYSKNCPIKEFIRSFLMR
jgi:hypothetical protein